MKLLVDQEELRPMVAAIARELLEVLDEHWTEHGERLAYSEPVAAELLGVGHHVLRDLRLAGKVSAVMVGGRIGYTRDALLEHLSENPWTRERTTR